MSYWIYRDEKAVGPLTADQVRESADPQTLVSLGEEWVPFTDHPDFAPSPAQAGEPKAEAEQPRSSADTPAEAQQEPQAVVKHRQHSARRPKTSSQSTSARRAKNRAPVVVIAIGAVLLIALLGLWIGSRVSYRQAVESGELLLAAQPTEVDTERLEEALQRWPEDATIRFLAGCWDVRAGEPPFERARSLLKDAVRHSDNRRRLTGLLAKRRGAYNTVIAGDEELAHIDRHVAMLRGLLDTEQELLGTSDTATLEQLDELRVRWLESALAKAAEQSSAGHSSGAARTLRETAQVLANLGPPAGSALSERLRTLERRPVTVEQGTVTVCSRCEREVERNVTSVDVAIRDVILKQLTTQPGICRACEWDEKGPLLFQEIIRTKSTHLEETTPGRYKVIAGSDIESGDILSEMLERVPTAAFAPTRELFQALQIRSGSSPQQTVARLQAAKGKYFVLKFGTHKIQANEDYPVTGNNDFVATGRSGVTGAPTTTSFECRSKTPVPPYAFVAILGRFVEFEIREGRRGRPVIVPLMDVQIVAAQNPNSRDRPGEIIVN